MTTEKTELAMRFEKAAELGPNDAIARQMGINPSMFHKIKNHNHLPKQHRVIKSINRYLEKVGL